MNININLFKYINIIQLYVCVCIGVPFVSRPKMLTCSIWYTHREGKFNDYLIKTFQKCQCG